MELPTFCVCVVALTQVSVITRTEVSPPTEAQLQRLLVGPAESAGVVDGGKGVLHVVEGHKAVVVAGNGSTRRYGSAEGSAGRQERPPVLTDPVSLKCSDTHSTCPNCRKRSLSSCCVMEPQMRPTYTTLRSTCTTRNNQHTPSLKTTGCRTCTHDGLELLRPALWSCPEPPTSAGEKEAAAAGAAPPAAHTWPAHL